MLCGCGGGLWGFQSRSIFFGGVILISENREALVVVVGYVVPKLFQKKQIWKTFSLISVVNGLKWSMKTNVNDLFLFVLLANFLDQFSLFMFLILSFLISDLRLWNSLRCFLIGSEAVEKELISSGTIQRVFDLLFE